MINRKIILVFLYSVIIQLAFAQKYDDRILNDSKNVEAEFDVAINPLDSNNIVLVTMSSDGSKSELVIYYTTDFGRSWSESEFSGLFGEYVSVSDPTIEFDARGYAYIVYLGEKNIIDLNQLDIDYNTKYLISEDKGATWKVLDIDAETGDKPWLVIDTFFQSPFFGNKYISGGGVSCVTVDRENKLLYEVYPDSRYYFDESMGLPCNAISKDGTLYIAYIARHNTHHGFIDSLMIVRSYDGGKSFGQIRKDRDLITYFDEFPRKIYGVTNRMSPKQYLAVDNSNSEFKGRVYLTYTGRERGNYLFLDVLLTYSDDDGKTWSTPKSIDFDAPKYTNQFFSSIFVNKKGYLILDWYDNREDEFGISNDFYFGLSKDGGQTFKTVKLTRKSSNFTKNGRINNKFGVGDYHQCVSTDNYAFSFWADGRSNDGDLDIYFAKIDLNNIDSLIISRIEMDIVIKKYFPNPVSDKLKVDFLLKKDMELKWQLFDNNFKLIKESNYLAYKPIKNRIEVSFVDLPSAIYYLRLISKEGLSKSLKVIKRK